MTDDNEDDEADIGCVATTRCHASRPVLTSSVCGSLSRQRDVNTRRLCRPIEDTECVRALFVHAVMMMIMTMMMMMLPEF